MRVGDVSDLLRAAHARYWELVRPAQLACDWAALRRAAAAAAAAGGAEAQQVEQRGQEEKEEAVREVLRPLREQAQVALAVTLDAGEVPCSTGALPCTRMSTFLHLAQAPLASRQGVRAAARAPPPCPHGCAQRGRRSCGERAGRRRLSCARVHTRVCWLAQAGGGGTRRTWWCWTG